MSASFSNVENLMDVNRLEGTLRNTGKKPKKPPAESPVTLACALRAFRTRLQGLRKIFTVRSQTPTPDAAETVD